MDVGHTAEVSGARSARAVPEYEFNLRLAKQIEHPGTKSPIWQRGFFDHLLRSDESYAQKWNYVRENPVRAGLVRNADDWPYSGEIVIIDRA